MGDFSTNILICHHVETSNLIDAIYSNSLYPTKNIPSPITNTSYNSIDNILYNNIT